MWKTEEEHGMAQQWGGGGGPSRWTPERTRMGLPFDLLRQVAPKVDHETQPPLHMDLTHTPALLPKFLFVHLTDPHYQPCAWNYVRCWGHSNEEQHGWSVSPHYLQPSRGNWEQSSKWLLPNMPESLKCPQDTDLRTRLTWRSSHRALARVGPF